MLIGVVGKPSVGKSSFFKAATLAEVEIANYPFTTIKPNHATAYAKIDCVDKEFNKQCNPRTGYCINHKRFIPIELLDVAGLVPGAHEGEGMGSQFLDDLNQADALIHVIDISGSTNEKGETIEVGSYDPAKDINFLEHELNMWFLRIIKKGWDKFIRQQQAEKGDIYKAIAKQCSGLRVTEEIAKSVLLDLSLPMELGQWSQENVLQLAQALRRRTKPMIIAANKVDIGIGKENLKRLIQNFPEFVIIPCSAASELALKEAAKKQVIDYIPGENSFKIIKEVSKQQEKGLEYIKENVLDLVRTTGIQTILDKVVFEVLNMIAIFPGGAKLEDKDGNCLPDCFLLKEGSTALDFAYTLHTDIGNGFIRAIDIKTKRTVGKEHLLKHRDVIEIITKS